MTDQAQSQDAMEPSPHSSHSAPRPRAFATPLLPLSLLALLLLAALVAARAWLACGWGGGPVPRPDGSVAYGVAFNANDNLSYAAWAQQASLGRLTFQVLYDTEPHRALMLNPFFLAVGAAARLAGVHPLLVLNLCGLLAAPLAVIVLFFAARALGLAPRGALLAAWLAAFGSGLSWLTFLLRSRLGLPAPLGADFCGVLGYYDLFPSTAFLAYPYHAVGFALLAAALWAVASAERALTQGRLSIKRLAPVVLAAAALAATRPYEPVALMLCYFAYSALGQFRRAPEARARWSILAALALGAGPFLAYSAWVALQPVWSQFARASLTLGGERAYWLVGFGLFWPLALVAAWIAYHSQASHSPNPARLGLPLIWAALLAFLLLALNSSQTKLAAGGFLSLALLAGHACDRLFARIARLPPPRRTFYTILSLMALLSMSGSLFKSIPYFRRVVPSAPAELIQAARAIRAASGDRIPTVLASWNDGKLLPGLAGVRVYAGHEAFTLQSAEKIQTLIIAGLQPDPNTRAWRPDANPVALNQLLAQSPTFDFILTRADAPAAPLLLSRPGLRLIFPGRQLLLFSTR